MQTTNWESLLRVRHSRHQAISAYAKPPTAEGSDLNTRLTCRERERESRDRGMEEGRVCTDYVDSECTQPHRKALYFMGHLVSCWKQISQCSHHSVNWGTMSVSSIIDSCVSCLNIFNLNDNNNDTKTSTKITHLLKKLSMFYIQIASCGCVCTVSAHAGTLNNKHYTDHTRQ